MLNNFESREPDEKSDTPARGAVETQLTKVLGSDRFLNSERLSEFLAFVVTQCLTGKELKEYSIGLAVFKRTPDFDPRQDAIVRSTANRLRKELANYYENDGQDDPILIELPKGHYIPRFTQRAGGIGIVAPTDGWMLRTYVRLNRLLSTLSRIRRLPRRWLWISAGLLASALSVLYWLPSLNRRAVTYATTKQARTRRLFSGSTSERHLPSTTVRARGYGPLLMSPDGTTVYSISHEDQSLTVIGVRDLHVKATFHLPLRPGRAAVSASGKHLYVAAFAPDEGVMVVDSGTGRLLDVIPTGANAVDLAVTPDEKKLFLAMVDNGLERIDLPTRATRMLSVLTCPFGLNTDPAGHRLYVAYRCGGPGGRPGHDAVEIYDIDSEQRIDLINDLPMVGQHPFVSPRGDLVLFQDGDACSSPAYDHVGCPVVPSQTIHLWDTMNRRMIASVPPPIDVSGVAFTPQGPRVILVGRGAAIWDWGRRMLVEKVSFPGLLFHSVALTPDGDRAFVSISDANDLLVFDAEKEVCAPPILGLANFYSGDGTLDDSQGVASLRPSRAPEFAPGRIGQAFRFNGKDFSLRTISGGGYCPYCEYSWSESLLVKLDSTVGEMTILDVAPGNLTRAGRLYKSLDNHFVIQGSNRPNSTFSIPSVAVIEAGRWYHVAVVVDTDRVSFYLDGALQGDKSSVRYGFGDVRTPTFLGASQGKRDFLNGLIDEVTIYNRALSAGEVKSMADNVRGCVAATAKTTSQP